MGVNDLFEAVISCDYAPPAFRCKPEWESYEEAMLHAGVSDRSRYFLVDDSPLNVRGALKAGWVVVVLFDEDGSAVRKEAAKDIPKSKVVSKLEDALASRSLALSIDAEDCRTELVTVWGRDVFTFQPSSTLIIAAIAGSHPASK